MELFLKKSPVEETYPPNQICRAYFGGRKSAHQALAKAGASRMPKLLIRFTVKKEKGLRRWPLIRGGALRCTAQEVAQNVLVAAQLLPTTATKFNAISSCGSHRCPEQLLTSPLIRGNSYKGIQTSVFALFARM